MRKYLIFYVLILSLFTLSPDSASAQWLNNGNNIYNSNSGNLGIGTTTPAYRLDVVGTGTTHGQSYVRFTNPTAYNLQVALNATSTGNANFGFTVNDVTKGAVGWNQSNNDIFFWNAVANNTNAGLRLLSNGDTAFYNVATGGTNVTFKSAGNVGIGTTTPGAKLEVIGAPTAHGGSMVTFTNPTAFHGQVNLNSTSTGNSNFGFQENGVTKGAVGWNVADDSMFFWNGVASPSNVAMKILSSGNTVFYNTATGVANATFLSTGNVGIGTTTPGELLSLGSAGVTKGVLSLAGDVSGKVIIRPSATAGNWTFTLPAASGTNGYFLQTDGSGNTVWAPAGLPPVGSYEVPISFGNGLLRTTNSVSNNLITGVSGGQTIVGGTDSGDGLIYKSTTGAGIANGVAHQFVGGTNGDTVALTLLNNGNVGVGVVAPTAKLDVNGNQNLNGNLKLNGSITSDGDICIGTCE